MADVARETTITYAGVTLGDSGDTAYFTGPIVIARGYPTTLVTFDVVIVETSEAAFGLTVRAIELAFTTPEQDLVVTQGGEIMLTMGHDANTGFNALPSLGKPGSDEDTGRSRLYRVTIVFQTPAFLAGRGGRQTETEQLTINSAGVRVLRITGLYTALPGAPPTSARENYDDPVTGIAAYEVEAQDRVDLTVEWERIAESQDLVESEDKNLRFDRTFREVIFNQSVGVLNDLDLVDPRMTISETTTAPGDASRNVRRLLDLRVAYSTFLDKSRTTDLIGKWESKILPHIVATVRTVAGGGTLALTDSSPEFNFQENSISASLSFLVTNGSNLVLATERIELFIQRGEQYIPVWNGDELAFDEYPGPLLMVRRKTLDRVVVSSFGGFARAFSDPTPPTRIIAGGFREITKRSAARPISVGIPGFQLQMVHEIEVQEFRRVNVIEVGSAGGGVVGGGQTRTRTRGAAIPEPPL